MYLNNNMEVGHCIDCCKLFDTHNKCNSLFTHLPKDRCPFCSLRKKEPVELPCYNDKGNIIGKSIFNYKENKIITVLFDTLEDSLGGKFRWKRGNETEK